MKIKSNIFWKVNNGEGYFKVDNNIYKLNGLEIEKQKEFWDILQNNRIEDLEEMMKENDLFGKYVSFIKMIGGFYNEKNIWSTYGRDIGMNLKGTKDFLEKTPIKIVGDEDLVTYCKEGISKEFQIVDKGEELAIVIARKNNVNLALRLNDYYIEKKVPFLIVLLEPFNSFIGPFVIPYESSCFRCLYEREKENIFYKNDMYELFNSEDCVSRERIPFFNIKATLGLIEVALMKYVFRKLRNQSQFGFVNTVKEFDWMKDTISEHKVIKNIKCKSCFSTEKNTASDVWVNNI